MRTWLQQKESLERDNDDATKQIEDLERELDNRNKELEKTKVEKESVEKTLAATKRHEEDLHERLTAAQQELGIRRVAEQTHKVVLSASFAIASVDRYKAMAVRLEGASNSRDSYRFQPLTI